MRRLDLRLLPLLAVPVLVTVGIGFTATSGTGEADRAESTVGADGAAVGIRGFAFEPDAIEIAAGSTVTWMNEDGANHSIVDSSGLFEESPDLAPGDTFEFTYDEPGEYPYICGIHQYMRGSVTVQ